MRKTLMLLAAVAAIAPASAQERDGRWIKKAIGRAYVCDGWGACRYEYRYGWVRHGYAPTYAPRVYGYTHYGDNQDKGPRCATLPNGQPEKVSAVGIEAFDLGKAKEQAVAAWAEIVRARIGGRYMDHANSEAAVFECWRSATGNRASEKAADFGGRELHQCALQSIPCRGKQEIADTEDPATEATIRRLRAMGFEVKRTAPEDPETPRAPRIIRRIFPKKE